MKKTNNLNCPRCRTPLVNGTYENELAMLCNDCSGVLIKQRSLRKILVQLSYDLYSHVDIDTPLPAIKDKGSVSNCPDCNEGMDYYGYMESNVVMIDYCSPCNWLWVDMTEFAAMAKIFIKSNKTQEKHKREIVFNDIVGLHMVTQGVSHLSISGMLLAIFASRFVRD